MGWGGGWGNRTPQTARDVAEAFYAGKARKRGNCRTDGSTYWLEGNEIAHRVPDDKVVDEVVKAIEGQTTQRLLEFSFCGWTTEMTCRHLKALGVDASIGRDWKTGPKGGRGEPFDVPLMNDRLVDSARFYTLQELAAMPKWEPSFKPRATTWAEPVSERQLTMAFA